MHYAQCIEKYTGLIQSEMSLPSARLLRKRMIKRFIPWLGFVLYTNLYRCRNICYKYLKPSYVSPEKKYSMIGYTLDRRLSCLE